MTGVNEFMMDVTGQSPCFQLLLVRSVTNGLIIKAARENNILPETFFTLKVPGLPG
jgi:hypothetical protein